MNKTEKNNADSSEKYEAFTFAADQGSVEVNDSKQVTGYAVVWGAVSDVRRDGYRHTFQKGSIQWAPIVNALVNHDTGRPLGSTANATLKITEDDYGAKAEIDLDDTTDGIDTFKRIKSKLIRGMSFGGTRYDYKNTADPSVILITNFVANEVTVTIRPAMDETIISTSQNFSSVKDGIERSKSVNRLNRIKLSLMRSRVGSKAN